MSKAEAAAGRMFARAAGSTMIRQATEIADLKQQLWLLLGDVKARAVSCTCHPPLTKHERDHIERAEALLAGYEPEVT